MSFLIWENGKSLEWTSRIIFTYYMNSRLIKLCLKSNTCEVINFPVIVPCLLPQISIEVPFAVIINPSQWHCQLFLICHLLLVFAKIRIPDVSPVYHVATCMQEVFPCMKNNPHLQIQYKVTKNTTDNIMLFHVINFNKQFDFRTHPLRGPPGY